MQSCIGSSFSNLFKLLFGKKMARVLMVGLDSVGQTSILYQLKRGEFIKTIPTVSFNWETIVQRGISLSIWDVGGGCKSRSSIWRHYFQQSQAVIFVVDSNDRERIGEAREELARLLSEDFESAIVLVLANKQDIVNAMNVIEITDKLALPLLSSKVKWHIQASCAVTGDGLREGIDWLALQLKNSGTI